MSRRVLALACAALLCGCGDAEQSPAAGAASAAAPPPGQTATAPHNGFGSAIAWRGLSEGFKDAASLGKPIMLLVHASWCSRCKALQPAFSDPELVALSRDFVMINVAQDAEPESLRHGPDGTYIPRVLFFDPSGKLDASLLNPTRQRFKYFFMPQDDLVGAMRRALATHGKS